ncbi:hypothetical protein L1987_50883 [Smallanthus sonchifolius]|uniref:Uncharacterized protein n=1 Tax=Smallanthus sonchifolius TaxID=185202 RepID=A0ACB9EPJ5_9ASTR|nr:hypothetical protein L1987_50883 [Smallanthus sonchifolius]
MNNGAISQHDDNEEKESISSRTVWERGGECGPVHAKSSLAWTTPTRYGVLRVKMFPPWLTPSLKVCERATHRPPLFLPSIKCQSAINVLLSQTHLSQLRIHPPKNSQTTTITHRPPPFLIKLLQYHQFHTQICFSMGICLSAKIKAESPYHTGVSSGNISTDGKGNGNSSESKGRSEGEILQSTNLKSFSYSNLRMATRNFRPDSVLGEGGFGSVYKGWIDEQSFTASKPGTGVVVAVKRLNLDSFQGHREWLAEVNYLGQFSHQNLVNLIGYCWEDEHRLLVYEFMPRGSLENHLFRRGSYFQPLSWSIRLKVALGAAKGLAFLHSAETKVIYRDFKTSNVLLDLDYNAKLSDFGLAKDGPTGDKSHVSTRVMGTYGYAAPEYLATGHLSTKNGSGVGISGVEVDGVCKCFCDSLYPESVSFINNEC